VIAIVMVAVGLAAVPIAARAAHSAGDATLEPEFVLDRYAALDASYQLLRALIQTNAGDDAEFYKYLKANSTLGTISANPVDVKLVETFRPAATPPHVFLFIVDSLRRDYLSPYNPAVTFTPSVQAFAGESVVFDRAYTRYGATGLSVPALWAGGMLLHKQYVEPFAPMNSLEKLLDATGYRRLMSDDHLVEELFRPSPATTMLDVGVDEMDHTVCGTVRELEAKLDASADDPRPIFAMTRPLQLHVARLARDPEVPASKYPGFAPTYAAQVAALDRCFGEFIDYLKRKELFEKSVVILTSDHGESLGEEGRWGHAYTLHPEVVQIPLLMHLPKAVAETVTIDPSRLALSTDITPTLYELAGQPPLDLGVLYGTPLFVPRGELLPPRRRDSFLMVSSYGPVYAMLRDRGRSLYIADAIEGRDFAYEMRADGRMQRLTLTDVMRTVNRGLIRDHIGRIAAEYRFSPPQ
jgi:membrane-anchored protein YejM (alkaline phosphatase superfamily)